MSMTLVQTVTVGAGGAASIEFTGIPQDGTDLVLALSARGTDNQRICFIRLNGDTGSNFTYRTLRGDGSGISSFGAGSSLGYGIQQATSVSTASTFGNSQAYFPNYTSSVAKSISVDHVNETNGTTAYQELTAILWSGTAPITTVMVYPASGTFAQFSTASLYKIVKA